MGPILDYSHIFIIQVHQVLCIIRSCRDDRFYTCSFSLNAHLVIRCTHLFILMKRYILTFACWTEHQDLYF